MGIFDPTIAAAPVAQLDRAFDYGSKGWEFESLRARLKSKPRAATVRGFSFTAPWSPLAAAFDIEVSLGLAYALTSS